ncbi:hypothetical protein [Clostridium tarantellae]|nr:hypothetical protein [Clostridium tarantellae]
MEITSKTYLSLYMLNNIEKIDTENNIGKTEIMNKKDIFESKNKL